MQRCHMVCSLSRDHAHQQALCLLHAGQGTMAVAACFGGPVLNLLMGTGAPVLGASFKHGILPFKLTHGVVALFLETVGAGLHHAGALLASAAPGYAAPSSLHSLHPHDVPRHVTTVSCVCRWRCA